MVLQPGTDDFLAVVEIFRADEADDRIDEQGRITARDRIGARLHGLLIDAVVRARRQRRALAGLEIHEIGAGRRAAQRLHGLMGLVE